MRQPPPKVKLTEKKGVSKAPADIKDSVEAQRAYARASQLSTQHFDTSSKRLDMGNPDLGDVDLGTIQADQPTRYKK